MYTVVLFDLNQKIIRYCSGFNYEFTTIVSDNNPSFHVTEKQLVTKKQALIIA